MRGYKKIVLTCKQAERDGLGWAWVDTCCIDKTSSAELSEAINSMYQWYEQSSICYAYLSDVDDKFPYAPRAKVEDEVETRDEYDDNNGDDGDDEYGDKQAKSRWFTRAWTLQELIASRQLSYYNRKWELIGSRYVPRLAACVSRSTGIPLELMRGYTSKSNYSAAQKMSWAAFRSSTRPEDIAYSLLGLFDINMPLLYGEGAKAFLRLQEEILKETDDHSLLCWTVPTSSPRAWTLESVFAKSPDDFARSKDIKGNFYDSGFPSAMTNRGLQVQICLKERLYNKHSHLYHKNAGCCIYDAVLNASEVDSHFGIGVYQMTIILVRTPQITVRHTQSVNRYARLATPSLEPIAVHLPSLGGIVIHAPSIKPFDIQMSSRHILEILLRDAELIYIHKTLLGSERDRFGGGVVHLQNIPIKESLLAVGGTIKSKGLPHDYAVKEVYYPGLKTMFCDATSLDTASTQAMTDMTWSPVYGCVKFKQDFENKPRYPDPFVAFGIESPFKRKFTLVLAWNKEYFHFNLLSGTLELGDPASNFDKHRNSKLFRKFLDPSNPSTHRGNCWEMRGEIARTSAVIEDEDIELTLERENPSTAAGQAAGNRLHLLIRASVTKNQKRSIPHRR
ncbi:HET-domain-containing protein [Hypoxylon crocopeplum]|nr:HET-domain-containing protein [Hypoxylon crocopeplum]